MKEIKEHFKGNKDNLMIGIYANGQNDRLIIFVEIITNEDLEIMTKSNIRR